MRRVIRIASILGVFCLLLGGCTILQPKPDPTRFFLLTPLATPEVSPVGDTDGISLGLGPINFPAYLDRPHFVTRVGPNQLRLSEYHRWGEPLPAGFNRVLAKNLATLLQTHRLVTHPWSRSTELDYRVEIEVRRFEATAGPETLLTARWILLDGTGEKLLLAKEFSLREPAESASTAASVQALSQALGKLSREIATSIQRYDER